MHNKHRDDLRHCKTILNGQFPNPLDSYLLGCREHLLAGFPAYRQIFEPKRYQVPETYSSAKTLGVTIWSAMAEGHYAAVHDPSRSLAITGLTVGLALLAEKIPLFLVTEEFARAVVATELPSDFALSDLHWPRQAFVLGFPRKFILEFCGVSFSYIFAAHLEAGIYRPPAILDMASTDVPKNKVACLYNTWHPASQMTHMGLGAYEDQHSLVGAFDAYPYVDYTELGAAETESNTEVLRKVTTLLFKVLCVLNATGGRYVAHESVSRPAKQKRGRPEKEALYSPGWIGVGYSAQRQGTGTHASPKMHWRRGHMAWVARGKRLDVVPAQQMPRLSDGAIDFETAGAELSEKFRNSHLRKWIEPVLVGSNA